MRRLSRTVLVHNFRVPACYFYENVYLLSNALDSYRVNTILEHEWVFHFLFGCRYLPGSFVEPICTFENSKMRVWWNGFICEELIFCTGKTLSRTPDGRRIRNRCATSKKVLYDGNTNHFYRTTTRKRKIRKT